MNILFVCRGNVGRSQMAEALFNKLTSNAHHVSSVGTIVKDKDGNDKNGQLLKDCPGAAKVIDALKDYGLDVSEKARTQLQPEMLDGMDKIVVMAEHENIPDYLMNDPRMIYWDVKDLKGTDLETHKKTAKQIEGLLEEWVKAL